MTKDKKGVGLVAYSDDSGPAGPGADGQWQAPGGKSPRVRLTTGPPASTLQIGTPRVNTAIAGNNHRRGYSRAQEWVHPNSVLPLIGICLAAVYPLAPVTP